MPSMRRSNAGGSIWTSILPRARMWRFVPSPAAGRTRSGSRFSPDGALVLAAREHAAMVQIFEEEACALWGMHPGTPLRLGDLTVPTGS